MSEMVDYKCPCCGGAIEFSSTTQKMTCPYCDANFDINALKDFHEGLDNSKENMNWDTNFDNLSDEEVKSMSMYTCNSCGGEIITDETTSATACPYCGNNVVIKSQFAGDLKPDYVIPFKVDKKAAKEALKSHLIGKKFLPKTFKDYNHIDEIKGVYVPFWLFNCTSDADIQYKAEKIRYWEDYDNEYTETTTYLATRSGNVSFERIPVDGSSKMEDDLMESIEPFEWKDAVDFETAYLAGYLAEKYDVSADDTIGRANERVKASVEDAFKKTVTGYDNVYTQNSVVRLDDTSVNYVLYPVWLLHTTWNNQKYTFAMNGQTGKFVGNLPLDKAAYTRYLLIVWAILSVISCAIVSFAF